MDKQEERIRLISKELGLSHVGSCISVLPVLKHIYSVKAPEDKVILDGAHAHLAHLVVREEYAQFYDLAEVMIRIHGIHCDRKAGCDASGGSLGHGLGIAIGMAVAERSYKHNVSTVVDKVTQRRVIEIHDVPQIHVILTEGSCMEGSTWEALRILGDLHLDNVQVYTNFNGYSAVASINSDNLVRRVRAFVPRVHVWITDNGEGLEGIAGHYIKL